MKARSLLVLAFVVCVPSVAAAQEIPAGAPRSDRQEASGADVDTYRENEANLHPKTQIEQQPSVSTTRTTSAEYVEQPGAEKRYRPNRPLLIAGAATFLGAYGTGVVVAAQSGLDADKRLYIPVAGMWLDVANRPCTSCTTGDTLATISFVAGGVAQVAGLALVAASFVFPEKERKIPRSSSLEVIPLSLAGGGGVGAIGTF